MGSGTKKSKEKESKKRRHRSRSRSNSPEREEIKRHKHHRHHKDRKREKPKYQDYESDGSDVVEVMKTPPPPEISKSSDALSIEETNALRAKLGLKPLQFDEKPTPNADGKIEEGMYKDDWGEFYHKPASNLGSKVEQDKLKYKLSTHKERRHVESKLSKVKLLGESDSSEDDAVHWVHKSRKLDDAKREAAKTAKMLEELDAQFGVSEIIDSEKRVKARKYTGHHLKGLHVDHELEDFAEGNTVILTLKDQEVLDEGKDALVNVNMLDEERYKKNVDNKKKSSVYKGYEDEMEEDDAPKSLLKKYDEVIKEAEKEGFTIGQVTTFKQDVKNKLTNKHLESLEQTKLSLASDYYTESEMAKFKKPKKKVRKVKKQFTADDLEQVMRADEPEMKMEEEPDDILERSLKKARELKQKQIISGLITVDMIKTEDVDDGADPGSSITLNATAEFCRTLGDIPTYGKSGNRDDNEELLDFEKEPSEPPQEEEIDLIQKGGWNAVDPTQPQEVVAVTKDVSILDEEPDVGSGVGAALKLAMSKGYLDKEEGNRPSNSRLAHLQAQHYSIEDKSYGEEVERTNRRERYTGPILDFKERDGFKPNVKLEYIDDEGHVLNAKEAFRYLSHKFHGKGPGKNKVEKRLKKQQQEGLMNKMSSTDTPLGTLNMLQSKQKEMQTPYIVLSGSKHTHSTTIAKARR